MSATLLDAFCFFDWDSLGGQDGEWAPEETYAKIAAGALDARRRNPNAFDAMTQWMLDDAQWGEDKLAENEELLMRGLIGRFRRQNLRLRERLRELEPSGVVNEAVFPAMDRFEDELSGAPHAEELREAVAGMFADFSTLKDRAVRERIAGGKTGPAGVETVEFYGYINALKACDAAVQWALFMPDMVRKQQDGFVLENLEYKTLPAMRFIGREGEDLADIAVRKELFTALDTMEGWASSFPYDLLLMHHYGLGVDVGPWHGIWGRFMKADAPVPEGFLSFDFVPDFQGEAGAPFCSQCAFALFSGDIAAMHKVEGYDSDAMYDVTRNTMLGQGVGIPYPDKYWTAEVFLNGCAEPSTAYLFSAAL